MAASSPCVRTDLEATYGEYEEWSDRGVPETLTSQYKKALQQLAKSRQFEETLVSPIFLSFFLHVFIIHMS